MPPRPLHCKFCRRVFLPVSEQAWSTVQCPHCSGQMKVGECEAAGGLPATGAQEYHRVTQQEEDAARLTEQGNRWAGKLVVAGFAGVVLAGAAVFWQAVTHDSKQTQKKTGKAFSETTDAEQREVQTLAQSFLGAKDWKAALALAADAQRVRGTMEWYYATRSWRPAAGEVKIAGIERLDADGREMLRVQAATAERTAIWLLLIKEGPAWKVDWELFADAALARWRSFVSEAPGAVVELPLLVARMPAADPFISKAGGEPESHDAVVVWARARQSPAAAVIPKASPLWKDLEGIGFEKPVSVIARVSMVTPEAEPPLVRLEAILRKDWVRGLQLPVAGESPRQ